MINYWRCSTVIDNLLLRVFSTVSFSEKSPLVIWPKKGQSISVEELTCFDQSKWKSTPYQNDSWETVLNKIGQKYLVNVLCNTQEN